MGGGLSLISQFSEITLINFAFFLSTLIDVGLHVDDVLFRRELSHASQGSHTQQEEGRAQQLVGERKESWVNAKGE